MRFKRLAAMSAIVAVALLGGCGGGGSGTTGAGAPPIATAPPPASPPPPPPAPSYTLISALTGNQTLQSVSSGVRLRNAAGAPIPPMATPVLAFGSDIGFGQTGSGAPYSLSGLGVTDSFATADAPGASPKVTSYSNRNAANIVTSRLIVETPVTTAVDLGYSRIFEWISNTDPAGGRTYFGLAAVPTIATDMPQTGTAEFGRLQVRGVAFAGTAPGGSALGTFTLNASIANCVADFANRRVLVQLVLTGTNPTTGTNSFIGNFTGSGTIGVGARTFTGTYTPLGNNLSGSFSGVFAGPQASECGLSFAISGIADNGSPIVVSGVQIGSRSPKFEILP